MYIDRWITRWMSGDWRNMRSGMLKVGELAVAFAVAMLLMVHVVYELSFDRFHKHADSIYRVESCFYEQGRLSEHWATSSFAYGQALKEVWPGLEYTCVGAVHEAAHLVRKGQKVYREERVAYADARFFRLFDFQLERGEAASCLDEPGEVVLSAALARRYFQTCDVVGRTLEVENSFGRREFKVSGVMKDMPVHSHIRYEMLLSFASLPEEIQSHWYVHECYTYVLLPDKRMKAEVERAFPEIAERHKVGKVLKNKVWGVRLVPLEEIHLNPQTPYEVEHKGSREVLWIGGLVMVAVLLVAWTSYWNLFVTDIVRRARKIGIRMALGASRWDIRREWMEEACVIHVAALVLAWGLLELVWPYWGVGQVPYGWLLGAGAVLVGVGAWIGWYVSGMALRHTQAFQLLRVMEKDQPRVKREVSISLAIQFFIVIFLSCVAFVVWGQIVYMQEKGKGICVEGVYALKLPPVRMGKAEEWMRLKRELAQVEGVEMVSVSNAVPGEEIASFLSYALCEDSLSLTQPFETWCGDGDFLPLYRMQLKEGRGLTSGAVRPEILVNETALRRLGQKAGLGSWVWVEGASHPMKIVGVVKDYHQRSLDKPYTPVVMMDWRQLEWLPPRMVSVRIQRDTPAVREGMAKVWNRHFPDVELEGFYVKDFYERQFRNGELLALGMGGVVCLIWLVACSGLWVLINRMGNARRKELGIRKLLGASQWNLMHLMWWHWWWPMWGVAPLACGCAWLASSYWLGTYAFHLQPGIWFFVFPVLGVMGLVVGIAAFEMRRVLAMAPAAALKAD